jgi:aryl-alcohol dehydrogenase-like predicted oxidoreductase
MQYQQLGSTGLFVSRLTLGMMTFGGGGTIFGALGGLAQQEADQMVGRALDAGINFIDTADVYAAGESEIITGKALGSRRHEVVLATKAYGRMGKGANEIGLSRYHIMAAAEASLRRLGTDHIDLYQIHAYDSVTPADETLRALDDLVRQGKVRYIGCSNHAAWHIMKALGISAAQNLAKFVSLQAYYSLVGRDLEHEIVPFLKDQQMGLMTWSPLAGGFLSGKFDRQRAGSAGGRRAVFNFPPVDVQKGYDIIDVLQKIASRHEVSVAQVALGWQLHKDYVTTVIIGARTMDQLNDNLGAAAVKLTPEDLAEIDAVSAPQPIYPGWMFTNQGGDRLPGKTRDWTAMAKSTFA